MEIPQVRQIDKVVGVPVVWQRQALTIQTDVPQIQCLESLVDVLVVTQQPAEIPVVIPKQVPTFQKIQNTAHDPQLQYCDKVVEVPVAMQRPVPSVQTALKIVEVPQIQHDDKVVDMPVVIQRQVPMTLNVQKSVEVARVIPHERLLRPAGGGSSVRERARRFEMEWGATSKGTSRGKISRARRLRIGG